LEKVFGIMMYMYRERSRPAWAYEGQREWASSRIV